MLKNFHVLLSEIILRRWRLSSTAILLASDEVVLFNGRESFDLKIMEFACLIKSRRT